MIRQMVEEWKNADLTPRIASGSQCSDQRPMVINEAIGWRLQEPSENNIAPVVDCAPFR